MVLAFYIFILLVTVSSSKIPVEWIERFEQGSLLFTDDFNVLSDSYRSPFFSNGYIGGQYNHEYVYISGLFNGASYETHRAAIPSPFQISLKVKNELNPLTYTGTAFDLEKGVIISRFDTDTFSISTTLYAHQSRKHVFVFDLLVDNYGKIAADLVLKNLFNETHTPDFDFTLVNNCFQSRINFKETNTCVKPMAAFCFDNIPSSLKIEAGEIKTFSFRASMWTTFDVSDSNPGKAALSELLSLATLSSEDLMIEHVIDMGKRWESSIEVVGNSSIARTVNSTFWAILQNTRENNFDSTGPGGLATDGYSAHVFWDMETYMFPSLALFTPDFAHNVLQYRVDRLDAAKQNARLNNYKGAQYPWESSFTGVETALNGNNAQYEIHISGDIVLAAWQYYSLSNDKNWLLNSGYPLVYSVALFYSDRADQDKDGNWHISHVTGSDEGNTNVNDSAWINSVAAFSLRTAIDMFNILNNDANLSPAKDWSEIADSLEASIPFDVSGNKHYPYQNYTTRGGGGLDVLLMIYPLSKKMDTNVKRANLDFYGKFDQGSTMGSGIFSIGYKDLGLLDKAESFWNKQHSNNILQPFLTWSEGFGGGGCNNFITGAGLLLQNVWAGYGGIRIHDHYLLIDKPMPIPQTTGLILKNISYRGNKLTLDINSTHISFRVNLLSSEALHLHCSKHQKVLKLVLNEVVVLESDQTFMLKSISTGNDAIFSVD